MPQKSQNPSFHRCPLLAECPPHWSTLHCKLKFKLSSDYFQIYLAKRKAEWFGLKTLKPQGSGAPNLQLCLPDSEFCRLLTGPKLMRSCETTSSPAQCFGIVGICRLQTRPGSPHPFDKATQHIQDPQTDLSH